jgi:hypothetical protein
MPGVKSVIGLPMDRSCVHFDQTTVAGFDDELETVIHETPAAFIYNLDERDCSEWADEPVEMTALVPADFERDRTFVLVDRHSK